MRIYLAVFSFILLSLPALAGPDMRPRDGWSVTPTQKSYDELVKAVAQATKSAGLIVVTQAGPTKAAANRGITIPGNRVIGVFNNDFAVRLLNLSTAAMIEAPIRLYVTENSDGTATLSYKTAAHVFAPYTDDAGAEISVVVAELDRLLTQISQDASN